MNKVLAELGLENMGEVNTIPSIGEDPKGVTVPAGPSVSISTFNNFKFCLEISIIYILCQLY